MVNHENNYIKAKIYTMHGDVLATYIANNEGIASYRDQDIKSISHLYMFSILLASYTHGTQ